MRIEIVRRKLARVYGWLPVLAAVLPVVAYGVLAWIGVAGRTLEALCWGALTWLPIAAIVLVARRDFSRAHGTLRREGDDLVIEHGRAVRPLPLATVRGGIIVPERNRVVVELQLSDGDQIVAQVADVAAGEALLRELRIDITQRRCRVQLQERTGAPLAAMAAPLGPAYFVRNLAPTLGEHPFFGFLGHLPASLLMVMAVGFYALAAALLQKLLAVSDVTIGADGLAFRRGFREIFVPFTELADVRVTGTGVGFVLRDGRVVNLRSIILSAARFDALKLRIWEAIALRDASPRPALEQLDRRGRSVSEWRASLTALARRGVDYRTPGLSTDDLEALLASPDATAERRIAAAVALSAFKHPTAPERIRIAAAQSASARLRVALEQVGNGEEDDATILEALAQEEPPRPRGLPPRREGRRDAGAP